MLHLTAPTTVPPPIMNQYHMIVLGIVGGILFTVICMSVVITCRQRRREERHRQHTLKQHLQRNTEIEMSSLLANRSPHQSNPAAVNRSVNHSLRMNHVGPPTADNRTLGNHITSNGNGMGPKAHTLPRSKDTSQGDATASGGISDSGVGRSVSGVSTSGQTNTEFDVSDLYVQTSNGSDPVTFRRYLDVNNYNDEDSSPNPSTHQEIPALVTVERPPPSPCPCPAPHSLSVDEPCYGERTPSPRPDVVQEERLLFPPPPSDLELRRLSVDTVQSEKSDVWKPMTADMLQMSMHPPDRSAFRQPPTPPPPAVATNLDPSVIQPNPVPGALRLPADCTVTQPGHVQISAPRQGQPQTNLQVPETGHVRVRIPRKGPTLADTGHVRISVPRQGQTQTDMGVPRTSLQIPQPKSLRPQPMNPEASRSRSPPQKVGHNPIQPAGSRPPPQRVAHNPTQLTVSRAPPKSPGLPRGSKSPPKPPKMSATDLLPGARYGNKSSSHQDTTPDIFYTRPNRGVTRHHPV